MIMKVWMWMLPGPCRPAFGFPGSVDRFVVDVEKGAKQGVQYSNANEESFL